MFHDPSTFPLQSIPCIINFNCKANCWFYIICVFFWFYSAELAHGFVVGFWYMWRATCPAITVYAPVYEACMPWNWRGRNKLGIEKIIKPSILYGFQSMLIICSGCDRSGGKIKTCEAASIKFLSPKHFPAIWLYKSSFPMCARQVPHTKLSNWCGAMAVATLGVPHVLCMHGCIVCGGDVWLDQATFFQNKEIDYIPLHKSFSYISSTCLSLYMPFVIPIRHYGPMVIEIFMWFQCCA